MHLFYRELLAGDLKLKPTDSTEKNVLPSAEDMKQEKNHQGILTGIEGFTSDSLKPTETKEKVVLPGKEEIKAEKTIQGMLQVCNKTFFNPFCLHRFLCSGRRRFCKGQLEGCANKGAGLSDFNPSD